MKFIATIFLEELKKKIRDELNREREKIEKEIAEIDAIEIKDNLQEKWMTVFHFLSKKWPNESPAHSRIEAFYIPGLDKFKPDRGSKSHSNFTVAGSNNPLWYRKQREYRIRK